MSHLDQEKVNEDKEKNKRLVLDAISSRCNDASPFEDLRTIGEALKNGSKLEAKIITGGVTNYSYKVYLQEQTVNGGKQIAVDNNQPALFAKLSFEYALWNPNKAHYDLARTDNEFKVMNDFYKFRPDLVPTPYHCVDIGDDMKLLVTQWSPGDEQLANQFIDGSVDLRIVPKIADAVAVLHCQEVTDPDFNTNVRPCMLDLFELYRSTMMAPFDEKEAPFTPKDRTQALFVEYGKDTLTRIADNNIKNYNARDCLVHSDVHAFNILVEEKPSVESLERFGPEGSVVLCDWEMAFVGPIGRDIGLPQAFPLACMVGHAMNGHGEVAIGLMEFIDLIWDEYAKVMAKNGKSKEELTSLYRNCLGWAGWFVYLGYYVLGVHTEFFPVNDEREIEMVKDSMGVLGLKLMRWAFGDHETNLTLDELRVKYKEAIDEEMHLALAVKRPIRRNRRSSVLRQSGRRISDASINFPDLSRLSFSTCGSEGLDTVKDDAVSE